MAATTELKGIQFRAVTAFNRLRDDVGRLGTAQDSVELRRRVAEGGQRFKSLALEFAKKGITVNTISPGYLRTPMVTKVPPEVLAQRILPEIPLGRLGEPDEVAELVAFLASERSTFITGANLSINGGQHMF